MGFERNYQTKIPSKQLNIKNRTFSTLNQNQGLNPWFITGFSDAESCFSIKIQENAKLKTKWRVRPVFSIVLHSKDLFLLEAIQKTLGVGKIIKCGKNALIFAVDSIKEIPIIINHFDNFPLITQKLSDYLLFKQCFDIIKEKEHLTERGLLKIIGLKFYLNLGLPDKLKRAFPSVETNNKPTYFFKGIPDPFWVSGFTSGEGSFHLVTRNSESKPGLFARFSLHLHVRELEVLKGIAIYFKNYNNEDQFKSTKPAQMNCSVCVQQNKKSVQLQISNFTDIINVIIPFFNKYPILGVKSLDFSDFKKACEIIKTKKHLTSPSVFNKIIEIKSGMNLNRKF